MLFVQTATADKVANEGISNKIFIYSSNNVVNVVKFKFMNNKIGDKTIKITVNLNKYKTILFKNLSMLSKTILILKLFLIFIFKPYLYSEIATLVSNIFNEHKPQFVIATLLHT